MDDVVIISGVRTAIGTMNGTLSQTPASDLAAAVIKEAVARSGIAGEQVDQVILGCVGQVAEDGYISRVATLKAGLPVDTPAYTVNRICGSGLEAINTAARWLQTGDAEIIVAGGAENMSMAPYLLRKGRTGYRLGHEPSRTTCCTSSRTRTSSATWASPRRTSPSSSRSPARSRTSTR